MAPGEDLKEKSIYTAVHTSRQYLWTTAVLATMAISLTFYPAHFHGLGFCRVPGDNGIHLYQYLVRTLIKTRSESGGSSGVDRERFTKFGLFYPLSI